MKTPLPNLAAPAKRALADINVESLEGLSLHSRHEIERLHGIGESALDTLEEAMKKAGLSFSGSDKIK